MSRAPATLAGLPAGIVDAWCVPLRTGAHGNERFTDVLDADERAHAARRREGAESWAVAQGALRWILAHYLGRPPASLRFARTVLGKPHLVGSAKLKFNLSWREDLALVAAASDREVGVDLEQEREDTDVVALSRDVLSPLERAAIEHAPPGQRRAAFFAAWTRHEARRKLHGLALEDTLPELETDSVVLVRALPVPAGFAAAIAAEGSAWRVRVRDLRDLG